jgi:hypothetical protein
MLTTEIEGETRGIHAERRSIEQIAENEACYQVQMLMRREPTRWRELFQLRERGLTWWQTLAAMQARKNGKHLAANAA